MMNEGSFEIFESVFSAGECEEILEVLSASSLRRSRAGIRHLLRHPAVEELAYDPRLMSIADGVLSQHLKPLRHAIPFKATLFDKSPAANWLVPWHQDTALPLQQRNDDSEWGPWSEKAGILYAHAPAWALSRVVALRVHLDASTAENGPLRVVPDSHTIGVLEDEQVARIAKGSGFTACLLPRGGVLMMRPLAIHSSSKVFSPQPRRVLHIEYADSLALAPDAHLAIA